MTRPKPVPKLKPPTYIKGAARKWWLSMIDSYSFTGDPAGLSLLNAAALQLARADEAREQISKDGVCIPDRFGQTKEHPSLVTERAALNLFRLLTREMGLEPADSEKTRLPRIAGRYA